VPDLIAARDGALGRITLSRPRAINALTLEMVRTAAAALDLWETDPAVAAVLIDGAGERGLSAGADIAELRRSVLVGDGLAERFFREEYRLNARLAEYPKPVVAVMDGIVMGGGVGLSGHVRHRVATERLIWAMPEVGIGFVPDVGGTRLLAHAPGELGTHLGLTAARASAGDALVCGFADVFVEAAGLPALVAGLRTGDVEGALATAAQRSGPAPAWPLLADRDPIEPS
jgi:enoyl-CoA hydratase